MEWEEYRGEGDKKGEDRGEKGEDRYNEEEEGGGGKRRMPYSEKHYWAEPLECVKKCGNLCSSPTWSQITEFVLHIPFRSSSSALFHAHALSSTIRVYILNSGHT